MRPEEKFSLRLLIVAIPAVFAVLGCFVSLGVSGTPGPGMFIGFLVGLLADAFYVPLIELYLVRCENSTEAARKLSPTAPATSAEIGKPGAKPETSDLDKEREERLKELKEAAEDPENMLDPVTVGIQEREIEADYQRKLAERLS